MPLRSLRFCPYWRRMYLDVINVWLWEREIRDLLPIVAYTGLRGKGTLQKVAPENADLVSDECHQGYTHVDHGVAFLDVRDRGARPLHEFGTRDQWKGGYIVLAFGQDIFRAAQNAVSMSACDVQPPAIAISNLKLCLPKAYSLSLRKLIGPFTL